jgi:hypothetical protein
MSSLVASVLAALIAAQAAPVIQPNAVQSIGPKQDDPRAMCETDGIAGQGGAEAIGPKQDDPRKGIVVQGGRSLAIGPKQDDPRSPALGAYNPETDPHASGGPEAIGPKQDDPRQGIIVQGGRTLEIGPKQDDPRSPRQLAQGSYNPETDPHAVSAGRKCKTKD